MTTVAPAPDLEIVTIDLPSEDYECGRRDCSAVAQWWDDCLACGRPVYRCDPHRRSLDATIDAYPGGRLWCKKCRATLPTPIDWRPVA